MLKIVEIALPKLGESIVSATVVNWFKKVGDKIVFDEPLLEVTTDKVGSEIPSPVTGVLKEILVSVDQEIEVGTVLARVEVNQESSVHSEPLVKCIQSQSPPEPVYAGTCVDIFSPAVLRLAREEGISLNTLRKIEGTGHEGRVSKKDLERFIDNQTKPCTLVKKDALLEDRLQMSGMRKAIAENMVRSFYEAPHASLVHEADVTEVMDLIAKEKQRFFDTHGVKLTITSFLLSALAKTLQQFPMLNASLEGETIVMKRYVNIGIAVNIEGGLVVPVIRHCHERNLVNLAKNVAEISSKARLGKLSFEDVADGTITLTNFGMTGAMIGIPIIRYPEVAIIGAGTVQKRVVAKEDDSIAIRKMIYLTLTFDHRVIDGIYGCEFLSDFKKHLESFPSHF
ncbi:MAG: 2-oxo acid dehydrogenase subunit E2 [Chlamydiia bacterium]|nr:2-oxo acid dehydrogenase subunit E2 [Chlamydiia bacterium]